MFFFNCTAQRFFMAAEEVLKLYDSYWFELGIFATKQTNSLAKITPLQPQNQEHVQEQKLSQVPSFQLRSQSLHCLCSETSLSPCSPSPDSVMIASQLQPLLSGKEAKEEEETETPVVMRRKKGMKLQRRNKKGSRSLSNLEFEELKGFMDLGFVFTEEDNKDSSLVSIIPGLQRYGRRKDGEETSDGHEQRVERPYLSEAWGVLDHSKVTQKPIKWTIPVHGGEIDMKDHLKVWAHSVASAVK